MPDLVILDRLTLGDDISLGPIGELGNLDVYESTAPEAGPVLCRLKTGSAPNYEPAMNSRTNRRSRP